MKLLTIAIYIFIGACSGCGLSEKCYREKEAERIINMTDQERDRERNFCVKEYEYMISITNHEKKRCNFWSCKDGKEDWRKRLNNCIWRIKNIKNEQ